MYVLSSVAVIAAVSREIIFPLEELEAVMKPSEPLSKTERTVVVEVEESMRGMC